jgi:integrase
MIQADLEAAGVPYVKEGRTLNFHALRVSFVSSLALSGVPLAVAQKLARHSDPRLTANVYTHLGLADLSRAVESLPPLPDATPEASGEQQDGQQEEPPRAAAG